MRNAIVPKSAEDRSAKEVDVQARIRHLAAVASGDADFLSCYLDLNAGPEATDEFLEQQLNVLRARQNGTVRLDLEQAADMVRAALEALWQQQEVPPAVAVFARGLAGGEFLSVVPLQDRVEAAVTFYRIPNLTPLVVRHQGDGPFTLVLARRGGLQVLDVDGAEITSRAWASFRENRRESRQGEVVVPQRRFPVLRRALSGGSDTPLVVAGDGSCLDEVTAAIPARAVGRLRDVLRIPPALDQDAAINFVRRRLAQRFDLQHQRVATRLVRAIKSQGLGVAGPMASYEALRADAVETLVIAKDYGFASAKQCDDCGSLQPAESESPTCTVCGGSSLAEWAVAAELVRLACRQNVPVIATDSEEIQYLGGVGCLLREPVEIQAMPHPAAQQPTLDLVA